MAQACECHSSNYHHTKNRWFQASLNRKDGFKIIIPPHAMKQILQLQSGNQRPIRWVRVSVPAIKSWYRVPYSISNIQLLTMNKYQSPNTTLILSRLMSFACWLSPTLQSPRVYSSLRTHPTPSSRQRTSPILWGCRLDKISLPQIG